MSETFSPAAEGDVTSIFPLRGQYHRKPAPTILSLLPTGCTLLARREPSNEFDPNAIMVLVDDLEGSYPDVATAVMEACEEQELECPDLSSTLHLAYIGKEFAEILAPRMDEAGVDDVPGFLAYMPDGKPAITFQGGEDKGDAEALEEAHWDGNDEAAREDSIPYEHPTE